jgi:hypothetical protein
MKCDEIERNWKQLKGKIMLRKSFTAIFIALAPVGALALVPGAPARAQQITISVSLFHQQLAPHGRSGAPTRTSKRRIDQAQRPYEP